MKRRVARIDEEKAGQNDLIEQYVAVGGFQRPP
jgi:hypothetical protein